MMRSKMMSATVAAALAVAAFVAVPVAVNASPTVAPQQVAGEVSGIAASLPAEVPKLDAVWCSDASQCLAVGGEWGRQAVSQVWNGRLWKYLRTPGQAQVLLGLSCLSWKFCMAVGGNGIADLWNGASWRQLQTPERAKLSSVSCATRQFCVAAGTKAGTAAAVVWNGRNWRATPVSRPAQATNATLVSVSCPTTTSCLAVGLWSTPKFIPHMWGTSFDGQSWQLLPSVPAPLKDWADSVSCTSATSCLVVGRTSELWNGGSWQQVPLPVSGIVELTGISCPSASFCLAVGSSALGWNGASWSVLPDTVAPGGVESVWCGSQKDCMAVGPGGPSGSIAQQWNGTGWRVLRTSRLDALADASCTSAARCMAIGSYVTTEVAQAPLAERWTGGSWQQTSLPPAEPNLTAVSCSSAAQCMAVGNSIFSGLGGTPTAARWNGHRWLAAPTPGFITSNMKPDVSCAAANDCVAVAVGAAIWNGTHWRNDNPNFGVGLVLQGVSCHSATNCVAVGNYATCEYCVPISVGVRWSGSAWTLLPRAPGDGLTDVSCPAADFCMATTGSGAVSWNGKKWRTQKLNVPGLSQISCAGTSSCMAVSSQAVEIWNGLGWRALHPIADGGGTISSVSCSRPDACVIVGQFGRLTMAQSWTGTGWHLLSTPSP